MFAAHYKLENLCAVIDYNRKQIDGDVQDVMGIAPSPTMALLQLERDRRGRARDPRHPRRVRAGARDARQAVRHPGPHGDGERRLVTWRMTTSGMGFREPGAGGGRRSARWASSLDEWIGPAGGHVKPEIAPAGLPRERRHSGRSAGARHGPALWSKPEMKADREGSGHGLLDLGQKRPEVWSWSGTSHGSTKRLLLRGEIPGPVHPGGRGRNRI